MGNITTTGEDLLKDLATRLPEHSTNISQLFEQVYLDFPVIFTQRLPLFAHRFNMIGITLCGNVYLLERLRDLPYIELLSILRHEAEHVKQQQRSPLLFYVRYCLSYIIGILRPASNDEMKKLRQRFGRLHAAYRSIPYEVDAYKVGDTVRNVLKRPS